jgi:hypothetical protein
MAVPPLIYIQKNAKPEEQKAAVKQSEAAARNAKLLKKNFSKQQRQEEHTQHA